MAFLKPILWVVALLSLNAFGAVSSSEKIYVNNLKTEFLIQRVENGIFYVEKYVQKTPGGFQDLIWQKRFSDIKRANVFFRSYSNNLTAMNVEDVFSQSTRPEKYLTEVADQVLWTHHNNWSWDWELKYADWVRQNVKQDFLVKYNIPTDCADLAYVTRWIFSRINSLPAANRLGGSSAVLSNFSMRAEWVKLPTNTEWYLDKRFMKALEYLMNNTYTHTLARDSYPIAITPETLIPGTHHLELRDVSGHTMYVYSTLEPLQVPLKLYYSNVPRIVRPLYDTTYSEMSSPTPKSGFLKMLWPTVQIGSVQFKKAQDMPFYSEEQYDSKFVAVDKNFAIAVMKRLDPKFSWENLVLSAVSDIANRFADRLQIVEQGYAFCQVNNCAPNSQGYEDWSTPSRDGRILEIFDLLASTASSPDGSTFLTEAIDALKNKFITIQNQKMSVADLLFNFKYQNYSSEPTVSISQRWGLTTSDYFENIKSKLENILKDRKTFVTSANFCKPNCVFGTDNWLKSLAYPFDLDLKNILEGIQYLKATNPQKYADLKTLMDGYQLENRTLTEWSEKFVLLNSDPRFASDFIDKKSTLSAWVFPASIFLKITSDKNHALLKSASAGQIQDIKNNTSVFETNSVEGYVADLNETSNQWLVVLPEPTGISIKVYQNNKQLISSFQVLTPEKILDVKIISSSSVGDYVLVKTDGHVNGYSIQGTQLFQYVRRHRFEDSSNTIKKVEFSGDDNQVCLFELDKPTMQKCKQVVGAYAGPYDIYVNENKEWVTLAIGGGLIAGGSFTYSFQKNDFLSLAGSQVYINLLGDYGGVVQDFSANQSYLVGTDSFGDLIKIKSFPMNSWITELSKGLYVTMEYTQGGTVKQLYFEVVNNQVSPINLQPDESKIGSAAYFNGETYVVTYLLNKGFRLRTLHGATIKDWSVGLWPELSVKNDALFLMDTITLSDINRMNYVAQVKLQSKEVIEVKYTEFIHKKTDSFFMGVGSSQKFPSGFVKMLQEDQDIQRDLMGLRSLNTYVYEP